MVSTTVTATTYRGTWRFSSPHGWTTPCPRPRGLQLGRQGDQRDLVGGSPDQHAPDREAVGRPVQGHADGGLARDVVERGEGGVPLLPFEVGGAVAVGVEPARPSRTSS